MIHGTSSKGISWKSIDCQLHLPIPSRRCFDCHQECGHRPADGRGELPSCVDNTAVVTFPQSSTTTNRPIEKSDELLVSNSTVPLPVEDIFYRQEFVSETLEHELLTDLYARPFTWEGFDQRRRVQYYRFPDPQDMNSFMTERNGHLSTQQPDQKNGEMDSTTSSPLPPPCLMQLRDMLEQRSGFKAKMVAVEEYPISAWSWSGDFAAHATVTTFECPTGEKPPPANPNLSGGHNTYDSHEDEVGCPIRSTTEDGQDLASTPTYKADATCSYCCRRNDDATADHFVAHVPLGKAAVQHINCPLRRQAHCWDLQSPQHWTEIWQDRRSLLIKTGAALWKWRSRLSAAAAATPQGSDLTRESDSCERRPVLMLRFKSALECRGAAGSKSTTSGHANGQEEEADVDDFGYIPHRSRDRIPLPDDPMPPLHELLTIVITTSPIKSHPQTELIEKAMETFILAGPEFAYKCRKVIVCDGYRCKDPEEVSEDKPVTKRHSNHKQSMRSGIVTTQQAENYHQFKAALRSLCASATKESPFYNAVVEELTERQGYGFALRHALRHCVHTQFVCVVQHDRTFMRPTPLIQTVEAMWRRPHIKYVGMSMRSNLKYRDIFLTKYGKTYQEDLNEMVQRVPELLVDASEFGPDSSSVRAMTFASEKLRENIQAFAETYRASSHFLQEQAWLESNPLPPNKHQISLTPVLFWYDNVHVCETKHYRDFIFHPSYKMVAHGGFVEDKLSPVIKRTVERLGLKEGHSRFACFLLDDHSGYFFTGHLDGGTYIPMGQRQNT